MIYEKVHLNEIFPFLGENGGDPILEIICQEDYFEPIREKDSYEKKPRPAVLGLPGGGYAITWAGEGAPVMLDYLSIGCNCFVLYYSTAPKKFPRQIVEVACALKYIRDNAEKLFVDKEKIAIVGFSAGGHLAASYCTIRNYPEVLSVIPDPPKVDACILGYPVISAVDHPHEGSFFNLMGGSSLTPEDKCKFSLEKHISKELTPETFIFANSDDGTVDVRNSLVYAAALKECGINFELHIFPTGGHGVSTGKFGVCEDENRDVFSKWTSLATDWLKRQFSI